MEKMEYMNGKFPYKRKKGKGYTPSRNKRPVPEPEPQAKGGAKSEILRKHGIDEHIHQTYWLNSLLLMTPEENLDNPAVDNVKGYKKSKLSLLQWSAYSIAKASLANAGEKGHIFESKLKSFIPEEITKVMGVYIIDGLAYSPRLL